MKIIFKLESFIKKKEKIKNKNKHVYIRKVRKKI